MSENLEHLLTSKINLDGLTIKMSDIEWENHPINEGVYAKHFIRTEHTNGKFSKSLIKLTKGHNINPHYHANNDENIEFIEGEGELIFSDKNMRIKPGLCVDIEKGTNHQVKPDDNDIYLIATFKPALY